MKRMILLKIHLVAALAVFSQQNPVNEAPTISFFDGAYRIRAELYTGSVLFNPSENKVYHWFANNEINETRGGFDGKLLHGKFIKCYPDKSLCEKGSFNRGIKQGKWIQWNREGLIVNVSYWRNGQLQGAYKIFDNEGNMIETGKYRTGKKHGRILCYENAVCISDVMYRNGISITKDKKKDKPGKDVKNDKIKKVKVRKEKTWKKKGG